MSASGPVPDNIGNSAEETPPPGEINHTGTVMEELKYYTEERDKLLKFSLFSSGISLLLAAASRIPTWEVSSPVAWLVGTVNVGFLPIFGPIFIFGTFLYALQRRATVADLRRTLLVDERSRRSSAKRPSRTLGRLSCVLKIDTRLSEVGLMYGSWRSRSSRMQFCSARTSTSYGR